MLSTLSNYRRLPFLEKGKQNRMAISFTKNGLDHTVERLNKNVHSYNYQKLVKIVISPQNAQKVANGFTFLYF